MSSNIKIINDMITQNSTLLKYLINNSKFEIKFKKFKKFKTIFIIGMGGSILGAKAIYDFLKHKIKKNFIFIDNLDENYLKSIKKNNSLSKSLFIIISKSGNTIETISNTYFFKSFLKSKNTIILTENKNSFLRNLAKEKKFNFLEHKKFIGGRYSVLCEVGMLPAYLMGLK
jgi:Glucose-6-phosphate isomerase